MSKFRSRKFLAMVGIVLVDLGAVLQGHTDAVTLGELAIATGAVIAYIAAEAHVDAAAATATGAAAAAAANATAPATAVQATAAAVDTARAIGTGKDV